MAWYDIDGKDKRRSRNMSVYMHFPALYALEARVYRSVVFVSNA